MSAWASAALASRRPEPILRPADGYTIAVLPETEPHRCGCGRAALLVINRGGHTRCLDCDAKIGEVR